MKNQLNNIKWMHEQIVKWLKEEGFYAAEHENPEVHYLINGSIADRKFDIYQLKKRHDQVVISAKVLFSPEHKQAFDQITNKEEFIRNINKPYLLPAIYFPKVYSKYNGADYFMRQQTPYDLNLLNYDKYQEFLNKRAAILAEKTNEFLDSLK